MTHRARHLQEDRLFDCYLAEQGGEPLDPRAAEHLADCPTCRAQYTDLSAFMEDVRSEADAEIDTTYSPEDLRRQQQQIAHRIEHLSHHARVITFPHHETSGPIGHASRVAPRWIAAAAAAGLVIGVGVGSFFQSGARIARAHQASTASVVPSGIAVPAAKDANVADPATAASLPAADPAAVAPAAQPADNNDEFMSELEFALERPRTRELLALDEMTPRVREMTVSHRTQ